MVSKGDQGANSEDCDKGLNQNNVCRDYIKRSCSRENCRFIHEMPSKGLLKTIFKFCHDYQNQGCYRMNCKFIHASAEYEDQFYETGVFPQDCRKISPVSQGFAEQNGNMYHNPEPIHEGPPLHLPPPCYSMPPPNLHHDSPPEAKLRKIAYEDNGHNQCITIQGPCYKCEALDHKVKLLHDNISVLLKKVADLTEKNSQLTSMNEFLLVQTASIRGEQSCVITSRHGMSAPVSLATVSMTPVVSLAGALPTLVPATATPNLALAPAASRAQLLTPAPQILTVSTTQQLVGNSGALIVTSAGGQQLMQVSDSGTLMGGGQTVVAVTPAQLTLAPQAQQLMSTAAPASVQQLVQQSAQQLVPSHQAQYAQQSVHLTAQQTAQHLAAQSAQLAAQSAQHLAQHTVQHLAQQNAQNLLESQQMQSGSLVHQTSQCMSSTSQPLALSNSQAQGIPWDRPMMSQNILPH